MFKFIVLTLLSLVGAGFVIGSLVGAAHLGLYGTFAVLGVTAFVMASYLIIPTAKNVLTGSAINAIGGGTSGGYNKVS